MDCNSNHSFEESITYQNLQKAFEGEAVASTKYAIYGEKAREQGYEQIANIFDETSYNEREHCTIWMKILKGGEIPDTLTNLQDAYGGESFEWKSMYLSYAQEARREGYTQIAELFEGVANIEHHHDARYRKLANNILTDQVFCKRNKVVWICLNCGNLIYDECAPECCPVCGYPKGFFQINCENY